jgi:hypothetical protein
MKVVRIWRNHGGAISVRNTAVAMLKGAAIMSAISDETNVPKINGSAPNCSFTGSHSELARNFHPNFRNARLEPCASS